jgi:hypothetical protein
MSHEDDAAWQLSVMPEKQGFIFVKHNETFSIEREISMFHALHCLSLVRDVLQFQLLGPSSSSHSHPHNHGARDDATEFLFDKHLPHCLSYIAQVSRIVHGLMPKMTSTSPKS